MDVTSVLMHVHESPCTCLGQIHFLSVSSNNIASGYVESPGDLGFRPSGPLSIFFIHLTLTWPVAAGNIAAGDLAPSAMKSAFTLIAFLLLVAIPFAPSSFLLLVLRAGASSSVLAPTSYLLFSSF